MVLNNSSSLGLSLFLLTYIAGKLNLVLRVYAHAGGNEIMGFEFNSHEYISWGKPKPINLIRS